MATQCTNRVGDLDARAGTSNRTTGRSLWTKGGAALLAILMASCSGKENAPDAKAPPKGSTSPDAKSDAKQPADTAPALDPVNFQIAINSPAGAQGEIQIVDQKINHARLDKLKTTDAPAENKVFDIQLHVPLDKVSKGEKIKISFEAKADRDRTADVAAILVSTPTNLGLFNKLELTKEWKPFEFEFDCAEEGPQPAISFNLGNDDAPIEIRKFVIQRGGGK